MQSDPIMEWQRLTEHYREVSDEELCELAADFADLTTTAQDALRQELRSRGLGAPETAQRTLAERTRTEVVSALERAEDGARQPAEQEPDGPAVGYTWKTPLCGCDSVEQAWQIREVLKRAGIESWIERPGSQNYVPWVDDQMVGDLQVLVAADELDRAREIVARPIPQHVIDDVKGMMEPGEYEPPVCPKCGAADPILEDAEPTNSWLCDACGAEWTDPIEDGQAKPEMA